MPCPTVISWMTDDGAEVGSENIINTQLIANIINRMPCEGCSKKFSMLRRKKTCEDCTHDFCIHCVIKKTDSERGYQCNRCKIFNTLPLDREAVSHMRVKDLRWFLNAKSVSLDGYKEKAELINLVFNYFTYNVAQSSYPHNILRHTTLSFYEERNLSNDASCAVSTEELREAASEMQPLPDVGLSCGMQPNATSEDSYAVASQPIGQLSHNTGLFTEFTNISEPIETNANRPLFEIPENIQPSSSGSVVADSNSVPDGIEQFNKEAQSISPQKFIQLDSIDGLEHIDHLSVMELKVLLTRNFVSYRGCCEKYELQEKVRWLWKQKETTKNIEATDDNLCKICMTSCMDSLLLDCGHMVSCKECSKRLSECPVCRQMIVRVVHIFRA